MKRLLAALAIVLTVLPQAAHAEDLWKMDKFRADISVGADGVVEVKETIDADFTTPRHGLYRYVPIEGTNAQGGRYRIDVALVSVTRDGASEPYAASQSGGDIQWKIGDPSRTLTGLHTYVISYDVTGALGAFDAYDEIYWNATGDGWDVPLPAGAAATVLLPEGVPVLQSACYTGPRGSTATDCQIIATDSQVGFVTKSAGEPLTVAVGFPKGSVPILKPSSSKPSQTPIPRPSPGPVFAWFLPLIAAAGVAVWLYRRWSRKGKDEKFQAIVAQYEPPEGLRPAEIPALLRQGGLNSLDIAATIVDLAVRGYVRIEETTGGFFGEKDYLLHLLKDVGGDATLKDYEVALVQALFGTGASPAQARVSQLRVTGFPSKVYGLTRALSNGLKTDGYIDPAADKSKNDQVLIGGLVAAAAFLFANVLSAFGSGWSVSLFCVGALTILFGFAMGKWTPKGHDAAWRAKGYKEFIRAVEKYRAPWMETQEVFEKTLPYAMAFGLGSRWAKAFASLHLSQPTWYQSPGMTAWTALSLHDSLKGFSGSMATHSGVSGSGGGGSSGGGGGGGGGGSW